jgi:hypothetical protein
MGLADLMSTAGDVRPQFIGCEPMLGEGLAGERVASAFEIVKVSTD